MTNMAPALSLADLHLPPLQPLQQLQVQDPTCPNMESGSSQSDMENLLGAELAQVDFLQVIKTMESGSESEAMFPLVGLSGLAELMETETEAEAEAETERLNLVRQMQSGLESRAARLERRLRLVQVRETGRHVAEEAARAGARALRARLPTRSAVRALLQRLECETSLPRPDTAAVSTDATPPAALAPPSAALSSTAGSLHYELSSLQRRLDPDATDSSSGEESADESVTYNNAHHLKMPITKRAMWKWVQERASIASRWTWLQAQIQELEYKIRQHTELQRRLRLAKGPVSITEPSGYSECLPGQSITADDVESCARLHPINQTFKKRKLLQMHNLHTAAQKASRPSNVRCICQWPLAGCAVCTGRVLPMHPLPISSTLTKQERLALVDPAYHPVLSSVKEVSASVQYSAKMKSPQWQLNGSKNTIVKSFNKTITPVVNKMPQIVSKMVVNSKSHSKKKKRSKSNRVRNTSLELARVIQARRRTSMQDGDNSPYGDHVPYPSGSSSPVPSPSDHRYRPRERTDRTRLNSSYDIDNIVIPYSIAANTKLEILQYKEIPTPKWRIVEIEESQTPNNGIIKKQHNSLSTEESIDDLEDVTEATVIQRHDRCEELEKGKYLQKRKSSRRQNSRSGGGNPPLTPSETPPHTPATVVDETSMSSEMGTSNPASNNPQPQPCVSTTSANTPQVLSTPANIQDINVFTPIQIQSTANINNRRRLTLQSEEIEIIPPYSPRVFPLSEETYSKMLGQMPDNHPLSIVDTEARRHHSTASCANGSDSETNSGPTFSIQDEAMVVCPEDGVLDQPSDSEGDSCSVPLDEDPNDPEWNAAAHAD